MRQAAVWSLTAVRTMVGTGCSSTMSGMYCEPLEENTSAARAWAFPCVVDHQTRCQVLQLCNLSHMAGIQLSFLYISGFGSCHASLHKVFQCDLGLSLSVNITANVCPVIAFWHGIAGWSQS